MYRIYIIFRMGDYTHPVAMTLSRDEANKYVQKCNKEDRWARYFIESYLVTNAISEFSCE
ncbi:MAG: hypothetical protein J6T10_16700 [Methanobrevibacter sp.]|nr:hypothetical protein [Methanobrevibacter sp.]